MGTVQQMLFKPDNGRRSRSIQITPNIPGYLVLRREYNRHRLFYRRIPNAAIVLAADSATVDEAGSNQAKRLRPERKPQSVGDHQETSFSEHGAEG